MAKPVRYHPFRFHIEAEIVKSLRRQGVISKKTNLTDDQVIAFMCHQRRFEGSQFGNALSDWVAADEMLYRASQQHVVFPESAEVLDTIWRSKFTGGAGLTFVPPFDSFVVMVPVGYVCPDGTPLKSFLVVSQPGDVYSARITELNQRHGGFATFQSTHQRQLWSVTMLDKQGMAYRGSMSDVELVDLLEVRPDEQEPEFKPMTNVRALTMDDLETRQIHNALRIAVGIAVFSDAYGEKFLINGLPKANGLPSQKARAQLIAGGTPLTLSNTATTTGRDRITGHVRSAHFRNLRAECYYHGEHKNKPRGSRWIPVKEHWVGDEITPHQAMTIKE